MSQKTLDKIESAKQILTDKGILFRELPNGQLQVDGVNFWATKEKWFDPRKDVHGVGINSFVKHITGDVKPSRQIVEVSSRDELQDDRKNVMSVYVEVVKPFSYYDTHQIGEQFSVSLSHLQDLIEKGYVKIIVNNNGENLPYDTKYTDDLFSEDF
jgi:hypothetical protein